MGRRGLQGRNLEDMRGWLEERYDTDGDDDDSME